jgi:kynureninase
VKSELGSPASRAAAVERDRNDALSHTRDAFDLPRGVIYLDGNSLGALPKATATRVADLVQRQWGSDLIRGWNTHDWIGAAARVGGKIAPLVGARPDEVIVADSTSVNLFKLVSGALSLRPGRRVILTEPGNFPTDLYILQGLQRLLGERVELRIRSREDLPGAIGADTAAVVLTHVHYKSSLCWPMAEITARAHEAGALAVWDLSHSAGALPVDLNGAQADLAVGCGYKYLNGGPGAPSFVFVARRWQERIETPLTGWMGHAALFEFDDAYLPAGDIRRQLCGTPGMLGLAALESGVDGFAGIDMTALSAKGRALGDLFIERVEACCAGHGLSLASPRDAGRRGSHVSFSHPMGYAIMQALIARGVIGDFRAPDILRFGFTPLYLSFTDVWDAVEILREVLDTGIYRAPRFSVRAAVT